MNCLKLFISDKSYFCFKTFIALLIIHLTIDFCVKQLRTTRENLIMHREKKICKMLHLLGKPFIGHLFFEYLKMIISTVLFSKIYGFKGC